MSVIKLCDNAEFMVRLESPTVTTDVDLYAFGNRYAESSQDFLGGRDIKDVSEQEYEAWRIRFFRQVFNVPESEPVSYGLAFEAVERILGKLSELKKKLTAAA